jgi:hypothetical protein
MDWLKALAFARRIAAEIAEGRLEASAVKDMTDEQLAEFDTAAYQALVDAQAENERLAGEAPIPPPEVNGEDVSIKED